MARYATPCSVGMEVLRIVLIVKTSRSDGVGSIPAQIYAAISSAILFSSDCTKKQQLPLRAGGGAEFAAPSAGSKRSKSRLLPLSMRMTFSDTALRL